MGMLYVDRKNVELRHEGGRILVYEQGRCSGSVPLAQLEAVVVQGHALLDTGLLRALAGAGVGLLVLDSRRPEFTSRLEGRSHNQSSRRLEQYRRSLDETWRARFSKLLVRRKVREQRRLLAEALSRRPDLRRSLLSAVRDLDARLCELGEGMPSRERLRGLEGVAARDYFQGYCRLFPRSVNFTGRNRRPPRDPVNACLSLAYTLLQAEAVRAVQVAGLDPMLGFFHDVAFGRDSLACDLVEPLRPSVDRLVWELFRMRSLTAEHFSSSEGGCLLGKGGRRIFYSAFESQMPPIRRKLRKYALLLARSLEGREDA
ncbi:CRISPR-associated endonuclease Cas1 [Thiohalobacter sp. IOR34]|uniref:CRISPR-associated endonuclease Cas1 n=1 Tax=Thiohalobacter sp. IOR34 TaxID=3057176 RepID=UPI0025B27F6E|nr:CRISPR-associated endonuclease Cas1 [Thiohalobacter sp. IOR34]WJW76676.1 CRISPR-associated endonuclease Cas1 [Thiohalobacter sp. IOR34]